jgi:hypothetical protein
MIAQAYPESGRRNPAIDAREITNERWATTSLPVGAVALCLRAKSSPARARPFLGSPILTSCIDTQRRTPWSRATDPRGDQLVTCLRSHPVDHRARLGPTGGRCTLTAGLSLVGTRVNSEAVRTSTTGLRLKCSRDSPPRPWAGALAQDRRPSKEARSDVQQDRLSWARWRVCTATARWKIDHASPAAPIYCSRSTPATKGDCISVYAASVPIGLG